MSETISRRNLFKRELHPLRKVVEDVIARADPIKLLELGAPGDEYDQEVAGIMRRIKNAASQEDVRTCIHEEFVGRFGEDLTGIPERYDEPAAAIWLALKQTRAK